MTKLYLLYDYGEYGPQNLWATLDVRMLPKYAEDTWPEPVDMTEEFLVSRPRKEYAEEMIAKYGTPLLTCRMILERWISDGCHEECPDMGVFFWGGPSLRAVSLDEFSPGEE